MKRSKGGGNLVFGENAARREIFQAYLNQKSFPGKKFYRKNILMPVQSPVLLKIVVYAFQGVQVD